MKGLVVGIANDKSIAWGCAKACHKAVGAEIAVTYQNDKAKPHMMALAEEIKSPIVMPLDMSVPGQMEALFEEIDKKWGKLDFLIHSIAFAPKEDLHGRVVDCSKEGFLTAMDISCHSFLALSKAALPLMSEGGSILTLTYYGSEKVVKNYNLMGPVKAALESCVRYLAYELGDSKIRVNAMSPGPIKTRAASGISNFSDLLEAGLAAPLCQPITIDNVGSVAAFMVSPASEAITGQVIYIDGGFSIESHHA